MNAFTEPAKTTSSGFSAEAKKHLGQNFLHDRSVIDKIVQAVDPRQGDAIVEIGPGQGALTFPLLEKHGAITAIEFDRDLHAPLQAAARARGELRLIEGDVLGVDFTALAAELAPAEGKIRLVGNLPYNLSSPILFHALDHAPAVRDMHFMLQKEVVERMASGPGSKVYGRLSVMLQAYCTVTPLFVVPPRRVPAGTEGRIGGGAAGAEARRGDPRGQSPGVRQRGAGRLRAAPQDLAQCPQRGRRRGRHRGRGIACGRTRGTGRGRRVRAPRQPPRERLRLPSCDAARIAARMRA
jgi:hypothetical protein